MRTTTLKAACLLALAAVLASPLAASAAAADVTDAKPIASLATYKRIKLDPVEVEFSRQWAPERTGSRLKVSREQREGIRAALATAVREELSRELQRSGTLPLTADAGPDVLRIQPRVVDVYLNAPDAGNAARTRTFVSNAGEMTLVAELTDSRSGQQLGRVVDRREATTAFIRLQRTDGMVNETEVRSIAAAWARSLRQALDRAHAVGS